MNSTTLFAIIAFYCSLSSLHAQIAKPSPSAQENSDQILQLRSEVLRLKTVYVNREVVPKSDDYVIFEKIGDAALVYPELIESLIDLSSIREELPKTFEHYPPTSISPAGRQLFKVGELAEIRIKKRLNSNSITEWQRLVLADVLESLQRSRDLKAGLPIKPPSTLLNTMELTPRPNLPKNTLTPTPGSTATPKPSTIQPPAPSKTPEAMHTATTQTQEPTGSTQWTLIVGLSVAVLGLFLLLLKRRS